MNTHRANKTADKGATRAAMLSDEPLFFEGTSEGESHMVVEYHPVPEPMLLRNHPTKRYAVVYELIPLGPNTFGRRLLSTTVLDLASAN